MRLTAWYTVRALPILFPVWTCIPLATTAEGQEAPLVDSVVVGQPLTVEEVPSLTLGVSAGNPEREFFRVVTPFLLPPNHIVVPLRGYGEIRVFTLDGNLVAAHGRPGEGPGEFRELGGAWARGDTIEAFDGILMRVTRFLPDGRIETIHLNPEGAGYRPNVAVPGGFHDGWLVTGVAGVSDSQRLEIAVARFSRDGTFAGTIARAEGPEMYSARGVHTQTPLSPMMFSATWENALYIGETLTAAVRVLDGKGKVVNEIVWEGDQISPEDALRRVVEIAVQRANPDEKNGLRERLEAAPKPKSVPVFAEFMVDHLGFVWVRPFEITRDATAVWLYMPQGSFKSRAGGVWWIFAPEGKKLGSVEIPPDLEPYQITADAVVGIRRDKLGIEYVRVHRLHRQKRGIDCG